MMIFHLSLFIFLIICLVRFMFVCIWRRMRQINDDLIVRIVVIWATFLSIWISFTDFEFKRGTRTEQFCSGIFLNDTMTLNWQEIVAKNIDLPR